MTTFQEIKKRLRMDYRVGKVKCHSCGKELEVPQMYSEKEREILTPYCCAYTVLIVQWLIHHGWHVTTYDAEPSGAYLCPDCFKEGTPEFSRHEYGAQWCKQAEKWMKENNGIRSELQK